ncbi:hypothetical protein L210DRAFT_3524264 [Boletus edulis BED1]|uniref:Uncharacterized protein n=1 Tax=Boletus edulis BED1 TaxID=1328754 RepID=A0AAD4C5D0_BOLED|nr:hypothetical protein L210DRAFT_3585579 [Boletus edulis BED1]KAF8449276.1 hypothetical protein L210DRAFT_3524264 [Boletus edulis BED1]
MPGETPLSRRHAPSPVRPHRRRRYPIDGHRLSNERRIHIRRMTTLCVPSHSQSTAAHSSIPQVSRTSKRSRSRDGHSISRLNGHPCPACDTLFPSLSTLRKHGSNSNISEACRVAVKYNFE